MRSSSSISVAKRARPLLGTLVRIRAFGLEADEAHRRIDLAFAAIERVHTAMSFHRHDSDIGRLNRCGADRWVRVAADTYAVLAAAVQSSAASDGVFDITIAPQLVSAGLLPPASENSPGTSASWRDIELKAPDLVRFRKPLWIDVGGIAKGYAVDLAMQNLLEDDGSSAAGRMAGWIVDAGGDIRVGGSLVEPIALRSAGSSDVLVPVVTLEDASLASSQVAADCLGIHVDGRSGALVVGEAFVTVVAPTCIVADALTKIVLAQGIEAKNLLRDLGATAFLHRPEQGWSTFGA